MTILCNIAAAFRATLWCEEKIDTTSAQNNKELENSYGLIINRLEARTYELLTADTDKARLNRERIMYTLCKKDEATGK